MLTRTDTETLRLIVAVDALLGPLAAVAGDALVAERLAAHDAARAAEAAVREAADRRFGQPHYGHDFTGDSHA